MIKAWWFPLERECPLSMLHSHKHTDHLIPLGADIILAEGGETTNSGDIELVQVSTHLFSKINKTYSPIHTYEILVAIVNSRSTHVFDI